MGTKRELSGTTRQFPHSYPTVTPQVAKVLSATGKHSLSTKEIMGMIGLKDKSHSLEPHYSQAHDLSPYLFELRHRITDISIDTAVAKWFRLYSNTTSSPNT